MKFGNYEVMKKVAEGNLIKSDNIIIIIRVLAISALLIGLSNPVIVQQVTGADADYVLALDASGSMFTSDVEPTRFDAAKEVSQEFVAGLGNSTSVGLISFSGEVNEEKEITDDLSDVQHSIQSLEMGDEAGAATGDAISSGVSMMISSERSRELVLVTDGRQNVGQTINESADFAARQNVTVHSIGIGDGEVDEQDRYGMVSGENATRADFPNLNENDLLGLANQTGGETIFVSDREGLETAFVDLTEDEAERDISRYLILLAGFLLILEAVVRTTDFQIIP